MSLSGNLSMTRRCFFLTAALAATSPAAAREARASAGTDNLPKAVILTEGDISTYLLVFHTDQEVMSGLLAFARKHKLAAGHLTGIGAISHVNIGYFDPATKQYLRSERNEQAEVLSFTGNLALIEKDPFFHVHVALALQDGSAFGGHLFEVRIRPTLELVLTAYRKPVLRKTDSETGLFLLDP